VALTLATAVILHTLGDYLYNAFTLKITPCLPKFLVAKGVVSQSHLVIR